MKKLVLATVFFLAMGAVFGQPLKKGNLIGTHVIKVEPKPDATIEQFQDFYINKVIPEFEKIRPGWKVYLVKGIRGDHENSLGIIMVIDSEETRDQYYNEDNSLSELGEAASEQFAPIREELEKLVTFSATFTDWLVL